MPSHLQPRVRPDDEWPVVSFKPVDEAAPGRHSLYLRIGEHAPSRLEAFIAEEHLKFAQLTGGNGGDGAPPLAHHRSEGFQDAGRHLGGPLFRLSVGPHRGSTHLQPPSDVGRPVANDLCHVLKCYVIPDLAVALGSEPAATRRRLRGKVGSQSTTAGSYSVDLTRRRFLTLLLWLTVAFVALAFGYQWVASRSLANMNEDLLVERARSAKSLYRLKRQSLETYAYDYSIWDAMVNFVQTGNLTWAELNIDTSLNTYHADFAMVFDKAGKLVYSQNIQGERNKPDITFSPEEVRLLFTEKKQIGFTRKISKGLVLIHGSTINPEADQERKNTFGYWIVGRYWNKNLLSEMGDVYFGEVSIAGPKERSQGPEDFMIPLEDFDGTIIAHLRFQKRTPFLAAIQQNHLTTLALLVVFGILSITTLSVYLKRWVISPLKTVGESLKSGSPDALAPLYEDRSEFGVVARSLAESFAHREALLHEISQRKRTEILLEEARDAAQQSARVKSEFLANMSHEIRTPLNGIIGMTELVLETSLDRTQSEYIETIRGCGESLLALINDILDISKIEAGKMTIEAIEFDLTRVVEEVGAILAGAAHAKNLELAVSYAPHMPEIFKGDSTRIRQILMNLVGNAVKFTQEGEVVVSVDWAYTYCSKMVEIKVSDTGIGIHPDRQDKIWESFTQADGSTTRKFGGTGLGLTISKRLVELMGGTISLESEPGVGSTFTVRLPLEVGSASSRPANEVLRGVRALIVDDNATNRRILQEYLAAVGCESMLFASAETALAYIDTTPDHGTRLVLTDFHMGGMDGMEFASELRKRKSTENVPIVLLSSMGSPQAETGDTRAVTLWLTKPVRRADLYEAAAGVLSGRKEERSQNLRSDIPRIDQGLRVLVAEDNVVNQRVAARLLERLGFDVVIVENGREAVDAAMKGDIHIILMDVQMPEMDGIIATKLIREDEAQTGRPRVPIIALTANAMEGDRDACLEAGMDDYVSKPVTLAALQRAVSRFVEFPAA